MTSNPSPFRGLFIPHVTPFDEAGALDLGGLERLTAYFTSLGGVAGLVSCARIGEGPVLSVEEKRKVYAIVGNVARKSGHVHIATIAPQSTSEAIALVRDLEKLPVDAVMIFPPLLFAWGKVGGDLKVRFFEDVSARPTCLWCSSRCRSKVIGTMSKPSVESHDWRKSWHSKKPLSMSIFSRRRSNSSSAKTRRWKF